jgi:hypothetical protein
VRRRRAGRARCCTPRTMAEGRVAPLSTESYRRRSFAGEGAWCQICADTGARAAPLCRRARSPLPRTMPCDTIATAVDQTEGTKYPQNMMLLKPPLRHTCRKEEYRVIRQAAWTDPLRILPLEAECALLARQAARRVLGWHPNMAHPSSPTWENLFTADRHVNLGRPWWATNRSGRLELRSQDTILGPRHLRPEVDARCSSSRPAKLHPR